MNQIQDWTNRYTRIDDLLFQHCGQSHKKIKLNGKRSPRNREPYPENHLNILFPDEVPDICIDDDKIEANRLLDEYKNDNVMDIKVEIGKLNRKVSSNEYVLGMMKQYLRIEKNLLKTKISFQEVYQNPSIPDIFKPYYKRLEEAIHQNHKTNPDHPNHPDHPDSVSVRYNGLYQLSDYQKLKRETQTLKDTIQRYTTATTFLKI